MQRNTTKNGGILKLFRKNNNQLNFFDLEIFAKMIPQDHPLVKIKENIDFSFADEELASYYSQDTGRPCLPPPVLFHRNLG